jgi:hypothetical protein
MKQKKIYQWPSQSPKKEISSGELGEIRKLVAYWDTVETGAPRVCLPNGDVLHSDDEQPSREPSESLIEHFFLL